MDVGLTFAAVAWIAMCVPMMREMWRGIRWRRASATVTGHDLIDGNANDGSIKVEFFLADGRTTVAASLWNDGSKFPFPHCWPAGSTVVLAYNPAAPTAVTWPRGLAFTAANALIMSLPVFAWVWHAL